MLLTSHDFIGDFTTSYRELARGQSQFNVYEVSNSSVFRVQHCIWRLLRYGIPQCLGSHFWHEWHFHLWHHCCAVFPLLCTFFSMHMYYCCCKQIDFFLSYQKLFYTFLTQFFLRGLTHVCLASLSTYTPIWMFPLSVFFLGKSRIYFVIITWMLTHIEIELLAAAWNRNNRRTIKRFRMIIVISHYFSWDHLLCLLIAYNTAMYVNYRDNSFKYIILDSEVMKQLLFTKITILCSST